MALNEADIVSRDDFSTVRGYEELARWWGSAKPSAKWYFTDSEILRITIRRGSCTMDIYAFRYGEIRDKVNRYRIDKHCIVTFCCEGIINLHLEDFSVQNVLDGIRVTLEQGVYRIELFPAFGIGGWVTTSGCSIAVSPLFEDSKHRISTTPQ
ncbi:MAG: hypothetical protein JNK48_31375 [Bryobacterales bacterium]|nr:hypothetical protein [Bryobacterales bacterium]